jgi:quercetin dioxygenase-like cupin family protein
LNNIGFGILTPSVLLVASTLCLQAAIGPQAPTENNEGSRTVNLRSVTLGPGGVVELRGDKDRPTVLHVIKGTLTSHPQGQPEAVLHPGDGLVEGKDSNYWIQNTGSEPAEFIFLPIYEYTP